jgi:hypothetical protein
MLNDKWRSVIASTVKIDIGDRGERLYKIFCLHEVVFQDSIVINGDQEASSTTIY